MAQILRISHSNHCLGVVYSKFRVKMTVLGTQRLELNVCNTAAFAEETILYAECWSFGNRIIDRNLLSEEQSRTRKAAFILVLSNPKEKSRYSHTWSNWAVFS